MPYPPYFFPLSESHFHARTLHKPHGKNHLHITQLLRHFLPSSNISTISPFSAKSFWFKMESTWMTSPLACSAGGFLGIELLLYQAAPSGMRRVLTWRTHPIKKGGQGRRTILTKAEPKRKNHAIIALAMRRWAYFSVQSSDTILGKDMLSFPN